MKTFGKNIFYLLSIITLISVSCKDGDIDSLSLTETEKYLSIGDTLQIGYIKLESEDKDYNITWSSSNKEVAPVNEKGLVVAKSEGKATITARCRKESANCIIHVVSYSFKNAVIYDSNDHSRFYLMLSAKSTSSNIKKENLSDISLFFDLALPDDSTNIVTGEYGAGRENSKAPYFYPGQRNPTISGSFLVKESTTGNDTLLITGGKFSVSHPELYFILGNVETEDENFSFIYNGGVPTKNALLKQR